MAATYTVKQVANILGYSTNSIYTFLKEKRIRGVRVGKGRFRIPHSEIDRLLLTKDKGTSAQGYGLPIAASAVVPQVLPTGVVEVPQDAPVPTGIVSDIGHGKVDVPSLFDWFVGMGSLVLGLAMFLFSRVYEEFAFDRFLVWMPAIRISLIAGGLGLLLSDVIGRKGSVWHKCFHWALILAYAGYTAILVVTGNWEGVVVYGVLAAILLFTFFIGLGGIAGFALYVTGYLALLPIIALFAPQKSTLTEIIAFLPVPAALLSNIWIAVVLATAFVLWLGYIRDRRVFWMGMLGVSIFLIMLSVHYAEQLAWGRSLFTLLTGLFSLFVPIWQTLTFTHKRDRAFVFGVFGSLLGVFLIVIGVIRVMQTNIMDYASRELSNKVAYGRTLMESTMLFTRTALVSTAANPVLVDSVEKEATEDLFALSKALFEGSSVLRRIAVIDAEGELMVEYPHGTSERGTLRKRDYFIQAVTTKKPVVSALYEANGEAGKRKTVVIVTPIMTREQVVVGVLVGSLDLETLGHKLQQLASAQAGEYFIVVDRAGKRVIHPENVRIGTDIEASDPLHEALMGKTGIMEAYSYDGIRTLGAHAPINDGTGWAIGVKAPITHILQATNAAGIAIFGVIFISILIIGVFMLGHRTRQRVPDASVSALNHRTRVRGVLEQAAKAKRRSGPPSRKFRGVKEDTS